MSKRKTTREEGGDWYRGPTALVQHSAYRGSSHQRKGCTSRITDMV
jgi:hypothetical protein